MGDGWGEKREERKRDLDAGQGLRRGPFTRHNSKKKKKKKHRCQSPLHQVASRPCAASPPPLREISLAQGPRRESALSSLSPRSSEPAAQRAIPQGRSAPDSAAATMPMSLPWGRSLTPLWMLGWGASCSITSQRSARTPC